MLALSAFASYTSMNYTAIQELLKTPQKIVITTHRNPDGDAIGSSLGLYHFLHSMGHDVQVVVPNPYPRFLQWMPGNETVIAYEVKEEEATKVTNDAQIIFSLDYNALHRMESYGDVVAEATAIKILIDHHQEPQDFPDHSLSDTSASSTAQLVYEFIEGLGETKRVNKDIAICLYTGIMTDTGSFRFSSTTARTHRIVADLMETGMEPVYIHQNISDTNTLDRLRLKGYALTEKLVFRPKYHTAYISLTLGELNQFNFRKGDTEGLVNYALSIEGVSFAILFTEDEQKVKISFRSKGTFNVNKFARAHFEGGGHNNAAGGRSRVNMKDTILMVENLLPEYKEELEQAEK